MQEAKSKGRHTGYGMIRIGYDDHDEYDYDHNYNDVDDDSLSR